MKKFDTWIVWPVLLIGNAFVIYLWLVFGLAAAGTSTSPEARMFIWSTAIGAGLPVAASMYCLKRQLFDGALVTMLLPMPSVTGAFFLVGWAMR